MGINFTECLKKRMCCWVTNPRKGITIAWLISLVLVLIAFIVACIATAKLKQSQSDANNTNTGFGIAAGFCGIWTVLLLILISITGTIIMRRYQTSLAIGFFLGVIFVMTQQMLILFAMFTESSKSPGQSVTAVGAQQAMAVFAFFIFFVYAIFGGMLSIFRQDIIKEEVMTDEVDDQYTANNSEMPPQEKELE